MTSSKEPTASTSKTVSDLKPGSVPDRLLGLAYWGGMFLCVMGLTMVSCLMRFAGRGWGETPYHIQSYAYRLGIRSGVYPVYGYLRGREINRRRAEEDQGAR